MFLIVEPLNFNVICPFGLRVEEHSIRVFVDSSWGEKVDVNFMSSTMV